MEPLSIILFTDLIEKVCVIFVMAYLLTRLKYFTEVLEGKLTIKNQIILILIFGGISIYGSYSGVDLFGAIANVRDLGPMVAGLVGGPIVGLGAGLIGGLHRMTMEGFTSFPCSLSTILAGLFAGIIYLANRKRFIGIWGAVLFSVLFETFHMILVLIMASPYAQALQVVESLYIPMILANAVGMFIFAFMISNLIKERATKRERDKLSAQLERRKKELEIAKQIQESFLPHTIPFIENYDLAASSIPAQEVGGDFYDFIPISKEQIGLTIGDVSGKGIPAALFMAFSRTLLRAKACRNPGVGRMIESVNNFINEEPHSNMFVTLFYSILDTFHNKLTFVNAGHNPPLLLRNENEEIIRLSTGGVVLGAMKGLKMAEKTIDLCPGDLLVLYTDGVTEAINQQEDQFGEERLIKIIMDNNDLSSDDLKNLIIDQVYDFASGTPQADDITLMVLRRML
ncbi:SpoIIE family protein phosphatase [Methanobacterium formicicum]|uniref:Stage II sporulation E family protein n=1 Tax=Methanobacterium formicicum (strain DSM 3637 / PP1) TaxID=1204725 RepID=K2QAZ6_METFP|nr:SpoIIE family protein phosphatase [Methanobacterium formicicum]EKF85141.1 stage II sporulation E family protein [Methanobacterium formicicum DSM 3637]